jgi:hypothetical protein
MKALTATALLLVLSVVAPQSGRTTTPRACKRGH